MNGKIISLIVVAVVLMAGAGLYFATENHHSDDGKIDTAGEEVVDALGRKITVPESLEGGIVTVGHTCPLRFTSLFDVYEHVIEIDVVDVTEERGARAYLYAYDYSNLASTHARSSLDTETVERIAEKNPSIVITNVAVWNNYESNFKILASKCTVVVLNDQDVQSMYDEDGKLVDYFVENVNILGKMFGMEKRASNVLGGIESIIKDIKSFSGSSDKMVYVAGVTWSGSNSFNTTFPVYLPLDLVNGTNAYKGASSANKVTVNIEDFTKLDIDTIVIDPASADKLVESDSQLIMKYLYERNNDGNAVNDVDFYVTVPIVSCSINYDCMLASAYYMDYMLYGTLTAGELKEKVNAIFELFYGDRGHGILDKMTDYFENRSSAYGMDFKIYSHVKLVYEDGKYVFKALSQ